MTELRTRRPTATPTWPRVLLSGEPGTDGAWMAAELTGDARIAASYWLEFGEANADVYAQADGANFEIIDHDGSWRDMYGQLCAAWETAHAAELPIALVVTSMSGVRSVLNDAANAKGRRRSASALAGRGLDPADAYSSEAEVDIGPDIRTLMTARHQLLIDKIRTWPGPVVLTARETRTPDGEWLLRAHDQLGFDVTAWVRLTRGDEPEIVVLDTAQHRRLTRSEREQLRPHFTLARLIWEWSGCDEQTRAPEPRVWDADQVMPGEQPPVRKLQAVNPRSPRLSGPGRAAPPSTHPLAEPLPPQAERVAHFTDAWLGLDDPKQIHKLWQRMRADLADALDTDVAGLLSDQQRAALSVQQGDSYSLHALADFASGYVAKTRTALSVAASAGAAS
ncbi:hypothetical protein PV646_28435 [Streptomyces sp. ID05-26A]|nr:hypothetical protein [Streptomyces sp. ID05-26A]